MPKHLQPLSRSYRDYSRRFVFIVSSYNQRQFVKANLESVYNQEYPKNKYRVIYVNDGSTDGSDRCIQAFTSNHPDVTFHLITNERNMGPAYSRHVACSLCEDEEVCVFLDGDDFLRNKEALAIISYVYATHGVEATFGSMVGEEWQFEMWVAYDRTKGVQYFPHLRTCYAGICKRVPDSYLKYENDEWFLFCTDLALFYSCCELIDNNYAFISDRLVEYNWHNARNNKERGYACSMTLDPDNTLKQKRVQYTRHIGAMAKLTPLKKDIHVVMCCWKRIEDLDSQLECMNNQTVAGRMVLHIVNNNPDIARDLENKIRKQTNRKNNKLRITLVNRNNKHCGFERFYYIRDHLSHTGANYVIIVDDDQLFTTDWFERMYRKRAPKHYITWYGLRWGSPMPVSYWSNIVSMTDLEHGRKKAIKEFHYGGTGGCIVDIGIFGPSSELWNFPEPNKEFNVFAIEDLWLSFVVTHFYNWTIQRSFLPVKSIKTDYSTNQALYKKLHLQKTLFLQYLIHKRNWKLT